MEAISLVDYGRSFQNEGFRMAMEDSRRHMCERIFDIVPGGGKSPLATIYANVLLHHRVIDSVLWFVPRLALCSQVRDKYHEEKWRIGGRERHIHYNDDNNAPLHTSDYIGSVQTYESLRRNPNLFLDWVRMFNGRNLVVFDELQSLADDPEVCKAIVPARQLWEAANCKVGLSGKLLRGDGVRVPFVNYKKGCEFNPPIEPTDLYFPQADITYSLRQAIADIAVRPLEFVLCDGVSKFMDDGTIVDRRISTLSDEDYAKAMDTFLNAANYRASFKVVTDMLAHWEEKCAAWNYRSKFLVIANDIPMAMEFYNRLKGRYRVCVATTQNADSDKTIMGFRTRDSRYPGHDADGLISVGKVYIGLDVPEASHMAFLRNFRTLQYVLQALMRIARIDYTRGAPHKQTQYGYAFGPDDPKLRQFVDYMRTEQAMGIADRDKNKEGGGGGGKGGGGEPISVYKRISAHVDSQSIAGLVHDISAADTAEIRQMQHENPLIARMPAEWIHAVLLKTRTKVGDQAVPASEPEPEPQKTSLPLDLQKKDAGVPYLEYVKSAARLSEELYGSYAGPERNWFEDIAKQVMRQGNLPPKRQRTIPQHLRAAEVAAALVAELTREKRNREEALREHV